ncbi:MAG TPA: radical SAM protein [Candidatus Deferrimicrobium sp.]|nr:radical SAM protein [Candidatus Deferrimicrobium sp.]
MPRILVVYPSYYSYSVQPMRDEVKSSPLVLASYLSQHHPVEYADLQVSIGCPTSRVQIKRFERKVRQFLQTRQFDILAISCWTSLSYKTTMTTARLARELYPNCLIVVGGYHATARPNDFVTEDRVIDYVIRGEGETALRDIAQALPSGGRPSQTRIQDSPSLQPDSFVEMNWELVDRLVRSEFPGGVGTLCVYLSRGCPFECSFCVESLKDRCWRPLPPERAIQQVRRALERFNLQAIAFGDACFGVHARWRKKFLKLLVDLNPSCWVLFESRPEFLDDDDVRMLARLKTEIQFGIESGSPDMLRLMNKTRQPERFLADFRGLSRRLSEHGIVHGANLIFNHPGETRKTLQETFDYVDSMLTIRPSTLMWACHGYMHFPGSAVDRDRKLLEEQFGTQFLSPEWWHLDEDPYVSARRVISSTDLGAERLDLWKTMLSEREEALKGCLTPEAFHLAADNYFPHWKLDSRYVGQ